MHACMRVCISVCLYERVAVDVLTHSVLRHPHGA